MSITFNKYSAVNPPCPPIEGAIISYIIIINNTSGQTLQDALFIDTMPLGLEYVTNSLIVNGVAVPVGTPFNGIYLGNILDKMIYQINFQAKIINAIGNYTNIAVLLYSNGGPEFVMLQTC